MLHALIVTNEASIFALVSPPNTREQKVCYAPGKSIPEAPTAASVRQDFYMEVTLALSIHWTLFLNKTQLTRIQ